MSTEPQIYSGEWWRTRTAEQLREQADGSFKGGTAYDGAMAEIAARAEVERQAEQLRWTKRTFWTALALGLGAIAATIITAIISA